MNKRRFSAHHPSMIHEEGSTSHMTSAKRPLRQRRPGMPAAMPVLALLTCVIVLPCQAQHTEPSAAAAPGSGAPAAPADPRDAVIEQLIRMLQQKNALSQDQVNSLMSQLGKQPQAAPAAPAAPAAAAVVPTGTAAAASATAETPAVTAPKSPKGDVRVMYIPESEKQRIRDEVKQEVLATAKAENWAQPFAVPEWVKHISFNGDLLFRQEFDFYDSSNQPMINYYAINSGAPYDVHSASDSAPSFPPLLDTTENRELPRLRFRLNMLAQVTDKLDVGMRLATGNDTNPVVTDQTYPADSNRINFSLDRAYINYRPLPNLSIWAGRVPNPWMYTNLVWDDDLNFDGLAIQYRWDHNSALTPFATVGAFSIENSAYTLSANGYNNQPSRDKWLYGAQFGADWKIKEDLSASGAVAYYYFDQISGDLSSPCAPVNDAVVCDTDVSRPLFMQKGNTLFALRNPSLTSLPNQPQFQYFGLASQFRELDVLLRLDAKLQGKLHWIVEGDYVNNLGFNASRIAALSPLTNTNADGSIYVGGNNAFHIMMQVGYPSVAERGDWSVLGGYKRIESDAVLDAFTDSSFHVGGTNAKGYYIQGNLGFTHNAWLDARWFSANEVSGPPLAIDVLQFDLNARF